MRTAAVAIATAVLTASGAASAAPMQWKVEDGGNDHWYEAVYVPEYLNWDAANAQAIQMGGYLATATSAAENEHIFNLVSDPKFWFGSSTDFAGPFLGGFQLPDSPEPDGGWEWVSGEPFSYTNWIQVGTPEPSNWQGREDKLHFLGRGSIDSTWNDTLPEAPRLGFIVEWEVVPEPSSLLLGCLAAISLLTLRPRYRANDRRHGNRVS